MGVTKMEMKGYRKAGRMGNSVGIGIPKEIVDKLNINQGDEYEVTADTVSGVITAKPVKRVAMDVNPEMMKKLDGFMEKYEETFKNLKDR